MVKITHWITINEKLYSISPEESKVKPGLLKAGILTYPDDDKLITEVKKRNNVK